MLGPPPYPAGAAGDAFVFRLFGPVQLLKESCRLTALDGGALSMTTAVPDGGHTSWTPNAALGASGIKSEQADTDQLP